MATVNKNFKVKNGLVVEGSTATVNGNNVLVETASDQYIIDLIGGETLVTSVESTQMEVVSGELNIKSGVFDASGAAAAAQSAAASDATTKAATAKSEAISAAASDATTKADNAKSGAEATAASALSSAISTEVSNRNTAISGAVSTLVDGAPDLLNTLNEIAAAINDDANYTTTITTALGTKAPLASPALSGVPTAPTAAANTDTTQIATTAFAKAEADAAEAAAIAHADALTTSDVAEGTSQYFTDARSKSSAADLLTGATKTNIIITGSGSGLVITAENGVADSTTTDLAEGANKYFTDARAITATAASYDILGASAAAQSAAASDATTKVAAEAALRVSGDSASVASAAADATTKANNAATSANSYTDGKIATEVTDRNNAISSAISTEVSNRNTAISTAVSGLVDGAPALLDTLNELALALGDSPDTITSLTTLVGTKAPLASPELTGVPTAPTAAADTNTTQVATTAFAKAEADAAQAAAEATAAAANTAQENGTTPFTALNINSEAKQIAASSSSLGSVVVTAFSWLKADYRSAKLMVKIDNTTDNEVSEILLTLDSSDNISITEYAVVGTNGSRGSITARVSGANVEVRVDPVNDSTIKVTGTLLK